MRHVPLAGEYVLAELLALDAAARRRDDLEAVAKQPLHHLQGVQLTVAVHREPNHEPVIQVPPGVSSVHQRRVELGEHLLQEDPVGAQRDPLAQIRADVHRDAVDDLVVGRWRGGRRRPGGDHTPVVLVRRRRRLFLGFDILHDDEFLDGLDHARDLVVLSLVVQQIDLVKTLRQHHTWRPDVVEHVTEHLTVAIDEVVLLQTVQDDRDAPVEQFSQLWFRKPAKIEAGRDVYLYKQEVQCNM